MTDLEIITNEQKIQRIQAEIEKRCARGFSIKEEANWSHCGFSLSMSEKFLMSDLKGIRYDSGSFVDYKKANLALVQKTLEKYGIDVSKLWNLEKLSRSSGTIRIKFPYYFDGDMPK